MTKKPSYWKCILGVVVLALLFVGTWAATSARLARAESVTSPTKAAVPTRMDSSKKTSLRNTTSAPLSALLSSPVLPGDDLISGVFEIDGDITDPAAGLPDDWSVVNCDGGGADAKTFLHDGSGVSIFTQGGSKDPNDISVPNSKGVLIPGWQWTDGSVPDKDDILNAYAGKYTGSPNGDTIIAFGADRYDSSGDAFFGAWFFQATVYAAADGSFREQVGTAPDPSDPLATHTLGDILVLINFTGGGGIATGAVYEWIPAGMPCPAGTPVGTPVATKTLCDITGTAPVGSVLGVSNDIAGPQVIPDTCLPQNGQTLAWDELYTPKTGTPGTIPAAQFFEGAINFDAFPRLRDSCFNSLLIETRSSSSPSAQLKDFVIGQFNTCPEISLTKEADDTVICDGDTTTYTYTVNNPTALNLSITLVDDNETPMDTTDDLDVLAACAPLMGGSPSSQLIGPGDTEFQCTRTLSVGSHTNTAKVVASIGGNSAEATASATVTVVAAPVADAGMDQTVCRDSGFGFVDFNIDGTATNGTAAWSFPSTNTAGCSVFSGGTTADPVIRCTSFGTATARLTVTSGTPGAECPNATDDVVLTINPNATAAAGDDQAVCVDDTSPGHTFEVTGTVTAATPVWSITGANSAGCSVMAGEENSLTAHVMCTNLGTATVQLLADSNNGCTDATDTLVLTVVANPEANAGPDQAVCATEPGPTLFTLAGTADHGTPAWSCVAGDCGNVSITDTSSLTSGVSFTGTGSATLQLTTTSNTNPTCGTAMDTVVLTVDPNPTVAICGDEACSTDEVLALTANVSPSDGTITYSWSGPGITSATNLQTITVNLPGTYTVSVTRTSSEGSPTCPGSTSMHVGLCPGGTCGP